MRKLLPKMDAITWSRIGELALENERSNRDCLFHGDSLRALRELEIGKGSSAIVIAAGPSIKIQNPAKSIVAANFKGAIITSESGIRYCLSQGIIPSLVVTVDPMPNVSRWFGLPEMTQQDVTDGKYHYPLYLDHAFKDQLTANEEILSLLDQYGRQMRIALATTSSPRLIERVLDVGMSIYWFNPMIDDPDEPDSITRQLQVSNGFPSVNAGGNVGSACWMMADAVLNKSHVALTGMDFSYPEGMKPEITQYYKDMVELVGKREAESLFVRVKNPHTNTWHYTDPAYMWYRQIFLEMAESADCQTFNCSGGGIIFGDFVTHMPLTEFLQDHG